MVPVRNTRPLPGDVAETLVRVGGSLTLVTLIVKSAEEARLPSLACTVIT